LLASLGSKGKNRNSLACLRNAGSYSAESYCTPKEEQEIGYCPYAVAIFRIFEIITATRLQMYGELFVSLSGWSVFSSQKREKRETREGDEKGYRERDHLYWLTFSFLFWLA
jgi:hypothetical protein